MPKTSYEGVVWDGMTYSPKADPAAPSPAWLTFAKRDVASLPFTVPASGKSQIVSFEHDEEGSGAPIKITHSVFADSTDGTAAAAFACRLFDASAQRDLMNQPIHIRLMAGVAQTPFRFVEPLIIEPVGVVKAEYNKLSGGATTMRHFLTGMKWSNEIDKNLHARIMERRRYVSPYFLTTEAGVTLGSGAISTQTIKIGHGHFQINELLAVSTGEFSLEIIETATRRTLANGAITSTNGVGVANYPFKFDRPYLIPQGGILRLVLTDLSAGSNTIYLALHGRMIYNVPLREVDQALKDMSVPMD